MDMGEVMDRLMDVFTMTPEREKSEREVLDRLVASMRRPPADSLIGALEMLTSAIASPAQDYVANKGVSGKAVREGLTGKRKTDWVDVVKTRYPDLNQRAAKVYGSVLNMLLDPTNLIPGGAIVGEVKNVYHGSPHLFDAFNMAKVGTGEGAQAYGHGMYFAEKKEVAEHYRDALSKASQKWSHTNKPVMNPRTGVWEYSAYQSGLKGDSVSFKSMDEAKAYANQKNTNKGHLYDVNLAPEEDEFLLWDKPLSEQSEKVKNVLEEGHVAIKGPISGKSVTRRGSFLDDTEKGSDLYDYLTSVAAQGTKDDILLDSMRDNLSRLGYTENDLVNGNTKEAVSAYLRSLGIRGIKYLDGTSRGKGEGAYNYVVFDDKDIKINKRK